MKSKILIATAAVVAIIAIYSFTNAPHTGEEYMEITTVESIVPMGLGRSKMMTTHANASQEEVKLENLYSWVGINFGNIQQNDAAVLQKINNLTSEGWELTYVTAGVQSPSGEGGQGIYLTRYLFKRSK